ncbi:AraC family ligand binding domain-containing protein, partial [Pseudomonas aeruginosa]
YCLERGLLVVEDEHGRQALPPRQIAWIPPGHPHSAHSHGSLAGWSAYLAAEHCRDLPRHPGVLACSAFVAQFVQQHAQQVLAFGAPGGAGRPAG